MHQLCDIALKYSNFDICDNLLDPLTVRINILDSGAQLPNLNENMSTMSSTTASGRDHALYNEHKLKSRMCLFVITQKDGTPFDAISVTEEDIIEICIKMGHTHPLGVLHYSAMESIALFSSTEEMQCATCRAVKVMEL